MNKGGIQSERDFVYFENSLIDGIYKIVNTG